MTRAQCDPVNKKRSESGRAKPIQMGFDFLESMLQPQVLCDPE